jgi:hypothetical protein
VETYNLATGGWKLTKENIDKILPDLRELLSGLPRGTPIIFFCLDNSSFLAASEEGGLVPISKCVPEDDGYHVVGSLVVAPEKAMQYAIAQLKRAIAECGDFPGVYSDTLDEVRFPALLHGNGTCHELSGSRISLRFAS